MSEATPRAVHRHDYTPPAFLVDEIALVFELDEERTLVRSTAKYRANPAARPTDTLTLAGVDLELLSLTIDGQPVDSARMKRTDEELSVSGVPKAFTLDVQAAIRPSANKALEGLYVSRGTFCTQCEAEGFRKITYFPDRPDVLARYTTTIIADAKRTPRLLSNGNLKSTRVLDDGRTEVVWEDPFPKPCYLFALVAGDLALVEDSFVTRSGRTVALHVYVEQRDLDKTAHCMRSLKNAMRFDEEAFGREYDLDLFQIVAISDFNMGAMENKGLNVFNTKFVLARKDTATDQDFAAIEGVVGHEYFHNWSGNRVTCRDWFQLSLKEGFTVYRDQEFSSAMGSAAVKRIDDVVRLRAMQFPEDAGPFAHPVRPDSYVEINNFYTVTIYEKGAEVVRMLETLVGRDTFRAGCDTYFARHDGQAVTCDDFVAAHEHASGRDLTQFRRWYAQAGTPVVRARAQHDPRASTLTLELSQELAPTPGQPTKEPMHISLVLGLLDEKGRGQTFTHAGKTGTTTTLELTEPKARVVLEGVQGRPVLSLNRGFRAPVKLVVDEPDDDVAFRMAHDSDAFNRWDASQRMMQSTILALAAKGASAQTSDVPARLTEAFAHVLDDETADPALIALTMTMPTPQVTAEEMAIVDVDGLFGARRVLRRALAEKSKDSLQRRYDALSVDEAYVFEKGAVARRSLKNTCLAYLTALESPARGELAARHLARATNMTDALAAMAQLTHQDSEARTTALDAFYARHKDDALVLDKWFALQAMSERERTIDDVKRLLSHEAFSLTNPNKVRALIGTFSSSNMWRFHAQSGEGYAFLVDQVIAIEAFNPQIAARIVQPLTRWRRFDEGRQAKMRAGLERILARPNVSRDVDEIVRKALA